MWRLGRRVLPAGIVYDGGSDWIALSNDFVSYLTFANNSLLRGLAKVYEHTLLPAESYFHTVLLNSEHCDTVIDNNLHLTNWKRRLGCKCQYKKIVDWCGCSPNDFKLEDWTRLQPTTEKAGLYFGRKFEPVVDLLVINKLETWIQDDVSNYKLHRDESYDKYWENIYDHLDKEPVSDEAKLTAFKSLIRLSISFLETLCSLHHPDTQAIPRNESDSLTTVHLLNENNRFKGLLITFEHETENGKIRLESWIRPKQKFKLVRRLGPINRLVSMTACSDFDVKELMFRNFGCIMGPTSSITLLHEWSISEDVMDDEVMNFAITFSWLDPLNQTVLSYEESIAFETPQEMSSSSLLLSSTPNLRMPLVPGAWKVLMIFHDIVVAETAFLVAPGSASGRKAKKMVSKSDNETTTTTRPSPSQGNNKDFALPVEDEEGVIHGVRNSLSLDAVQDEDKSGLNNKNNNNNRLSIDGITKKSRRSRSFEYKSESLIDSLISTFWSVQEVCFVEDESDEEDSFPHHHQPIDLNDAGVEAKNTFKTIPNQSRAIQDKVQNQGQTSLARKESDWICSLYPVYPSKRGSNDEEDAAADSNKRVKLNSCSMTSWSTFFPDPKSEII